MLYHILYQALGDATIARVFKYISFPRRDGHADRLPHHHHLLALVHPQAAATGR